MTRQRGSHAAALVEATTSSRHPSYTLQRGADQRPSRSHADQDHRRPRPPPAPLEPSHYTRLYDWAGHARSAVRCFARDVRRMPLLEGVGMALGGLPLYRHLNTPCLNATICGIVVGVTAKERKVIYEIDDGTAVLRVHVAGREGDAYREQKPAERRASKAEQRPTGIPSCYVRPPSPKRSKYQTTGTAAGALRDLSSFSSASWSFECTPKHAVGELVRATGRIRPDFDGDRILSPGKLALLSDANDESRHFIEAIGLAEGEYGRPLTPERVQHLTASLPSTMPAQDDRTTTTPWDTNAHDADEAGAGHLTNKGNHGRHGKQKSRVYTPTGEDVESHRRLISPPTSQVSATPTTVAKPEDELRRPDDDRRYLEQSKKLQKARKLLSSQSDPLSDGEAADDCQPSHGCERNDHRSRAKKRLSTRSSAKALFILLDSSHVEGAATVASHPSSDRGLIARNGIGYRGTESHRRHDASISIDISRSRQPSVASFASSPGSTSRRLRKHQKLSDSKVTDSYFRLQVQKHLVDEFGPGAGFSSQSIDTKGRSKAFSVSDLAAQKNLRELAERLVRIKLARRAQKASATTTMAAESLASTASSTASSEPISDKVTRLFQWTVRQMMTDGFIILATAAADYDCGFLSPVSSVIDLTGSLPLLGGNNGRREGRQNEEMYQLVTSKVLAEPLLAVLRPATSVQGHAAYDAETILWRLSQRDNSFSSLTTEAVEAALYELMAHSLVSRSSSGRWTTAKATAV